MANVQVLAQAEMLKCNVDAVYKKEDTKETMVVYGKPQALPAPQLTLDEVTSELGSFIGVNDIVLPGSIGSDLSLSLQEIFYSSVKESPTAQPSKEYAVALKLHAANLTADWPIKVKTVSLIVWDTQNPKIINEMGIAEAQTLLEYVSAA